MTETILKIGSKECLIYADENPSALLIQPIESRDNETISKEIAYISEHTSNPFSLVTFPVDSWNSDLSPWMADPVFGKEGFGDGANNTLDFIQEELLPQINMANDIPIILGGYSLAGLFALWSCYQTDIFSGIAAASPSAWFPNFLDYTKTNRPNSEAIYISLGDKEEKAKNPTMSKVGDCIRELNSIYIEQNIETTLVWNEGNHFKDPELRTAKAFTWCLERINHDN